MLGSGDLNERWRAADALGELGDSRAVQPLIEALEEEATQVANLLRDSMENVIDLSVPLVSDIKTGRSWYDTK